MKSFPYRTHFSPIIILSLLAFGQPAIYAENSPSTASPAPRRATTEELVITKGTYRNRAGETIPATVGSLVDAITQRFPGVNIHVVGAENIVIENLRLRWSRPSVLDETGPSESSMHAILNTLREASLNKFNVTGFGMNEFLISARTSDESRRKVEVFKISPPASAGLAAHIQVQIDTVETELAVYAKRFPTGSPEIDQRTLHLETLKAQLARVNRPPEQSNKDLEQIQDVIRVAMERISPGEAPPELKYHPGTGLMIVVGSETAIDVTRKVVAALRAGPH